MTYRDSTQPESSDDATFSEIIGVEHRYINMSNSERKVCGCEKLLNKGRAECFILVDIIGVRIQKCMSGKEECRKILRWSIFV